MLENAAAQSDLQRQRPLGDESAPIVFGEADVATTSPPLRAGSITLVLPAIGAGGSEHVVSMLCNHFVRRGLTIRLVCFDPPGTKPFYPLDNGVALTCLGLPPHRRGPIARSLAMLQRYRRLKTELRRHRPDLVIAFLTRTNVLAALAARTLSIPVVVSERNNPQRQPVGAVWGWLRRLAYRRADALVTMTHGAVRFFDPVPGRIDQVIPNHASLPREPASYDQAGTRLVAVGRLVDQKGFDLLLQAFARIADRFPSWELVIWGEGPLREELEQLRHDLGLDDRVAMPGITSEPGAWVSGADLFVLSSRFEGWGLVVGEAMAAGIPVVSFDCPWGPGEMIEHGRSGLLVPDQNVAALAATLAQAMVDSPLRQRLGETGREAMKRHAPERILAQWEALIARVVRAPVPRGSDR